MRIEKEVKDFVVEYDLCWENEVSIEQIENDIKKLKELNISKIFINANQVYDQLYVSFEPIENRLETDEEYNKRVQLLKHREKEEREYELNLLESLKKKYEK